MHNPAGLTDVWGDGATFGKFNLLLVILALFHAEMCSAEKRWVLCVGKHEFLGTCARQWGQKEERIG